MLFFSPKKYNIVITGANGQLGSFLLDYYRKMSLKKYSMIGQVFGITRADLDLTKRWDVSDFFNTNVINPPIKIDYVIHCAAATNTTAVEKDPVKYFADNVLATKFIASSCRFNKIKMIFISSDYVLSEEHQDNMTSWPIESPVNQYGFQKLMAEMYVKDIYKDWPKGYMILRPSWMYGNSKNSFVEKFLRNAFGKYNDSLSRNYKPAIVDVDDDSFGRPTHVKFLADFILKLIAANIHGTINAQQPGNQISRATWAEMIFCGLRSIVNDFSIGNMTLPPYTRTFIKKMLENTNVNRVSSKSLNLPLRHPGKVTNACTFWNATLDCAKKYKKIRDLANDCSKPDNYWMTEYLKSNLQRIIDDIVTPLMEVNCSCKDE